MTDLDSSPSLPNRTTLLAFVLFVIVSGGASVAIRFTYAELPKGRTLTGAVLFGVFSMGPLFLFIYWGLVKTPASLYQTIMASVLLGVWIGALMPAITGYPMVLMRGRLQDNLSFV